MQRDARIFWSLIAVLLGSSIYFGIGAESRRREAQVGDRVALETGDIVKLAHVIEGDTLMVTREDGARVVVRLLGIKTFDPRHDSFGTLALRAVEAQFGDKPARALVARGPEGEPLVDRKGRMITELFVGDTNLGLSLVAEGLALVYTPDPFEAINTYLDQQGKARERNKGVWGDPAAIRRADARIAEWARRGSR